MEILRVKKRQLEASEVKPQLVGHVEVDEKGELLKVEAEPEEPDEEHGRWWYTEATGHTVYYIDMGHKTEGEHREAGVTVVCIGSEEDYHKCKFRRTTGGKGNDNRNTYSKFPRGRRNGTDRDYFNHGRWYCGFRSGNVEPRG